VSHSDLEHQLAFVRELDRLKAVYRQTRISADNSRRENSAEHSWHIALMSQILQEHAVEPVNIQRATQMLLIHDVVEIDAGDTFAFAAQGAQDAQAEAEVQAAERLFGLLPAAQCKTLKALWFEFEAAKTVDARYAKAMDRFLPMLQNMQSEGGSWVTFQVSKSQVLKRQAHLEHLLPVLWTFVLEQAEVAVAKGWLSPD